MDIVIEPVKKEEKEILRNLLEKYNYEFSQYDKRDVKWYRIIWLWLFGQLLDGRKQVSIFYKKR